MRCSFSPNVEEVPITDSSVFSSITITHKSQTIETTPSLSDSVISRVIFLTVDLGCALIPHLIKLNIESCSGSTYNHTSRQCIGFIRVIWREFNDLKIAKEKKVNRLMNLEADFYMQRRDNGTNGCSVAQHLGLQAKKIYTMTIVITSRPSSSFNRTAA